VAALVKDDVTDDDAGMTAADTSSAYRAIIKAVSDDALHTLDAFIAPDLVDHNAIPGQPAGCEGFKYWARSARRAFPDLTGTVEDVLTDGDKLAGRVTWRGRHRGDLVGVAGTGDKVEFPAFHIVRFSQGRAVEWWGTADLLGALVQVGARLLRSVRSGLTD